MFNKIKTDLLPSLVVFLIALPLCMGIAIASGLQPISGLITGVVGGILVGILSGAPLQVSGPAAGLAVIVWQFVDRFSIEGLAYIILIAGVIQMLMGLFKLGQLFRVISPAIIQGMLAGIGTLIMLGQWHVMLDSKPLSTGLHNLVAIPQSIQHLIQGDAAVSLPAFLLGVLAILIMAFWPVVAPKKLKIIPGSLLAAVLLTTIASVFALSVKKIALPDNILSTIHYMSFEHFSSFHLTDILLAAATMAFVASAETLLSAIAVDQMHNGPRANYDRELFAQGVGNAICGFLGALPMTGVIVRSGANVQAGAKTRASAIMHGIWILVFVLGFPFVLKMIPVSALAAILVFTGYKLVNAKQIAKLWTQSRTEVAIFFATYATIVFVDLLKGILVGVILAVAKLLYTLTHIDVNTKKDDKKKTAVLRLSGTATFLRLPKIASALDEISSDYELHLHIDELKLVDHACLELFENTKKRFEMNHGKFVVEWEHLQNKFGALKPAVVTTK